MIYHLAGLLKSVFPTLGFLRILEYITVRSAAALFTAFVLSLLMGPWLIEALKRLKAGQPIRKTVGENVRDLSEMHGGKSGTPTMGGVMILLSILISALLFCDLTSPMAWLIMLMTIGFGAIGFSDDYLKLRLRNSRGLPGKYKLLAQAALGAILAVFLLWQPMGLSYNIAQQSGAEFSYANLIVPLVKQWSPSLGAFFVPFVILVLCSTSNAVNLTDGLDGLAIGCTVIGAMAFMVITYLLGRADYSVYLNFPYVPQGGELTIVLGAMIGAGLGFLWFNSHPAEIFMGDTGSLALGGVLGSVAVIIKQELLLVVIGGIFVIEALSVLLQVGSFKLRGGKRIFRMAPIHHHFERGGLHESKIIIRFWIVAILLALIGIASLKLR
ncbi:phospho-N-acetylmuramoyl-pentapeptide-transferase [Candidatus Sumerlaeota bacterium]|nr:phospho-N-acetylmuramoyl-pentapeptide-transferase [Candidatus Sumerlaeota bacterium]